MNLSETTRILSLCAAYDSRTIGETDVIAWHDALSDVPFEDAKRAVVDFYRSATDGRMKPGNVWAGVKKLRRDRVEGADTSFVPPQGVEGESEGDYARRTIAAKRRHLKALGDGTPAPVSPQLAQRFDPQKLMPGVFKSPPRIASIPSQRIGKAS